MSKQPIVHEQFIRSMIKWLSQAESVLVNKYCAILFLEHPELAKAISERLVYLEKRTKGKNNEHDS